MAVRALGLGFPAAQAATCSPGFSDQAQFPAGTAGYALTAVQTGILPGHTGGRFHPRAPLSQTEAEAMALQVQRIMAGEGIPTFRCRLRHYDEDTMVQMLDPALRLRMVEGRVYACVRDLFQAEAQLRFQRGLEFPAPCSGLSRPLVSPPAAGGPGEKHGLRLPGGMGPLSPGNRPGTWKPILMPPPCWPRPGCCLGS